MVVASLNNHYKHAALQEEIVVGIAAYSFIGHYTLFIFSVAAIASNMHPRCLTMTTCTNLTTATTTICFHLSTDQFMGPQLATH